MNARRGAMQCAAAAVLFGASTPLASRLVDKTSAVMLAGLLYVGAAGAVAPFAARHRPAPDALRRGAAPLAIAVVAGGLVGPVLLTAGLARTPAAAASLLLNLELVATAILAAWLFREHIGRRVAVGTVAVMVAGVALAWSESPQFRLGALLIVAACLCWGLDNCVTAELEEIAPAHITLAKGVVAGGTNIALAYALGASTPERGVVLAALAVGAVGYGASITLWVAGARELGAARAQLVFASAPFVGVLVAWLALGDAVRPVEVAAMVLAAFGVSRLVGSDHLHEHHHHEIDHDHEHTHDDGHHQHEHASSVSRHAHPHAHAPLVHAHPHVPDVHHRHTHSD